MPRCQRTSRLLPGNPNAPRQACPFCVDHETYTLTTEADLLHYSQVGFNALVGDFGKPTDAAAPIRLWYGLTPECVRGSGGRGYDLYLGRDSDALQLRLQIGHEMFHRVCSQGRVFHWTHEALACVFSIRLLRQCGFTSYAETMDAAYRVQAESLPLSGLFTADVALSPYPPGLYGRAYTLGEALKEVTGWPALCRLTALDQYGQPPPVNLFYWQQSLPTSVMSKVERLLTRVE